MPDLATWRDIAILVLAILWIVLLLIVIFIFWKVKSLIDEIPRRIEPLINTAQRTAATAEQTATTMKGTVSFASRTTVMPLIRIAAIGAATTRFVEVMLGRHKRREGA